MLSDRLAVFAYMYTSKFSPACSGETGSVTKTPPLLVTPVGALSPLPTVVLRSSASHQLGCAWILRKRTAAIPTSTASSASRSATSTRALPAFAASNHAEGSDVQLQCARYRLPELCVPLVSQSKSRVCDSVLCVMRRTTFDGCVTRTLPWLSVTWYATRTRTRSTQAFRVRSTAVMV